MIIWCADIPSFCFAKRADHGATLTDIHIDTDIGGDIDDLCAIAMVLKWPDAELLGVTTVAEHGGKRAGYARYALSLAGRGDIPVAAGARGRLRVFSSQPGLTQEQRSWRP